MLWTDLMVCLFQHLSCHLSFFFGLVVTPQEVLEVFKQDLISKNLLTPSSAQTINPLDLGELILQTYILYPLNHESSIIPYNYCILPNLLITHEKLGFVRDGMETLLSFIGCQY